jgi:hypothetical protein
MLIATLVLLVAVVAILLLPKKTDSNRSCFINFSSRHFEKRGRTERAVRRSCPERRTEKAREQRQELIDDSWCSE